MTELIGKDNAIAKVAERAKPTLVMVGNRMVVSTGRWNNPCLADYVRAHGRDKWIPIGDIARTAFSQNTPRSKERARRCLNRLFRYFLETEELLVVDYGGPRHRAIAVKLFSRDASEAERQSMAEKLERMKVRAEMSQDNYAHALWLMHEKRDAPGGAP
jgi:hypothetical protein